VHEQGPDLIRIFQAGQHRVGLFVRDIAEEVGRLIRLHLIDDTRQLAGRQRTGQLSGLGLLHLLQNVGGIGGVEPGQQRGLVGQFQLGEHFSLVGRAQPLNDGDGLVDVASFQRSAHTIQRAVDQQALHAALLGSQRSFPEG
jgi:hypothetical protein